MREKREWDVFNVSEILPSQSTMNMNNVASHLVNIIFILNQPIFIITIHDLRRFHTSFHSFIFMKKVKTSGPLL